MPNLNMPDEGGGGRPPITPMMPGRDTGGIVKKIVIVLVVLLVGGGGFYLYKSGKLSFLKKAEPPPPPVEVVPSPDTSAVKMTAQPPVATTTPATKADTKPAATHAPATGKGDFTIVIASFQSRKTADGEASRWSSAGFQSMVNEKASKEGNRYRVSLGRYENRQEAMKAAKEMEHMFESGFWIDKVQ